MDEAYAITSLSPLRKVIAARMTEAKQTIPHFRLTVDIEIDPLLELRRELRALAPQFDLSLNDLLVKCCASALMDVPAVNLQWAGTHIHQYHSADISVVTRLKDGLSTPIVRNADSKTVWEIARELKELTALAAKNALKMQQVFGGSFSVSNLGMYDVDQFDAIVNPPQCAILALGRAKPAVVIGEQREMRIATVLRATLSADHRAIDGATGAAFLSALRRRVTEPGDLRTPPATG